MSGIKRVRYAARDAWSGSTDLLEASAYLKWKNIRAIPPQDHEFEKIIHMIQVDDQLIREHLRTREVLEKWSAQYPDDVRRGRLLYKSGELHRIREEGDSAADVVN